MTETIVKPVNPSVRLMKEWGWVVAAVLVIAQQCGWLTAEQIESIKRVIPVESTTETITVETTTKPAKLVEPPEPKTPEVAAIKPEDFRQWADLIRKLIDELRPAPQPLPPSPNPVEPDVVPVDPKPLPTDSRIVISDETGKPVTAATVEAGALFLATAPGGQPVAWQVSKHGSVRVAALPANAGFAFSLDAGSFIELFLTDFSVKSQTSIRITCNSGPRPPPNVVPDVEPVEPVVTSRKLALEVVVDHKKITPATAIVLNSVESWNSFILDGHTWQIFSHASPELLAKQAIADSAKTTLPTLCIYDQKSRWPIAVVPLPASVDELRAVVRMYEGGAK